MIHNPFVRTLVIAALFAVPVLEAAAALLVRVRNVQTNSYLTAEGNSRWLQYGNEPVRLRALNPNDQRQLWRIEFFNENRGAQMLWNVQAGRILEMHPQTRMATTNLRVPGVSPNQGFLYYLTNAVEMSGDFRFGNQCLDAYYRNHQYGPEVGLWSCHGGRNQKWVLEFLD